MSSAPTTAPTREHAAPARWDAVIVIAMAVMYAWSFFQRVAVPGSLFTDIQAALDCSATAVTGLASVYLFIYAPGQFVTGYLADRFGGLRVMAVGSVLLSAGALGFPAATSLGMLYAFRSLVATGATVMYLCTVREIATRYDARGFSRLVGPVLFMGGVGGMLGTSPTAWLAQSLGWRGALFTAGVLTTVSALVLLGLMWRGGSGKGAGEAIDWQVKRGALTNPRLRPLYFTGTIVFVCYFLFQAVIGPKYLQDVAGVQRVTAASVTMAMQVTSMLLMLSSGVIGSWYRHRRRPVVITMVMFTFGATLLLLAACYLRLPWPVHAAGFLLLGASNGLMPLHVCGVKEVSPAAAIGVVIAVTNGLTYVAVAMCSNGAGLLLDCFEAQRIGDVVRYPAVAYAWLLVAMLPIALTAVIAGGCFVEPAAPHLAEEQEAGIGPNR